MFVHIFGRMRVCFSPPRTIYSSHCPDARTLLVCRNPTTCDCSSMKCECAPFVKAHKDTIFLTYKAWKCTPVDSNGCVALDNVIGGLECRNHGCSNKRSIREESGAMMDKCKVSFGDMSLTDTFESVACGNIWGRYVRPEHLRAKKERWKLQHTWG